MTRPDTDLGQDIRLDQAYKQPRHSSPRCPARAASVIDGLCGGVPEALVHPVDVRQGVLRQVDVERRKVRLRSQRPSRPQPTGTGSAARQGLVCPPAQAQSFSVTCACARVRVCGQGLWTAVHLQLLHAGRADDRARHVPPALAPGQRELRGRQPVPLGDPRVLRDGLARQRLVIPGAARPAGEARGRAALAAVRGEGATCRALHARMHSPQLLARGSSAQRRRRAGRAPRPARAAPCGRGAAQAPAQGAGLAAL